MRLYGSLTELVSAVWRSSGGGTITVSSPSTVSARTLTLPDATDTLVGKATTDTFTNKTFDAAGTGNSLSNIANANISNTAAIAYSKLSLSGSIVNADINSAAAIVYSKLSLSNSIVNADVNASAAIAYSKLSLSNSIVNADINASAAIASSKLNLTAITNLAIRDTSAAFDVTLAAASSTTLTAGRTLTLDMVNAARTLKLGGNLTLAADLLTSGANSLTLTTTASTNVTLPTTGTLGTLAGAETLTNKTMGDALTLTEIATPANPSSGLLKLYSKSGDKLYTLNSAGTETQVGASGSGELNAVLNPNDAAAGWTAGTSHAVATDTSHSPLSPIITTSVDASATTTASESSTSGVIYTISTFPAGMKNRKMKVEFWFTTSASQTWAVSVYSGSTRMSLSTDSAGASTLPAGVSQKYTTTFDADSSSSYTLNLTRTAGSGTTHLYLTDVIIGPGVGTQGAAISGWTSYTPVAGNVSTSSTTGFWRRVGESMEVVAQLVTSAQPSGIVNLSLPSGFTINSSVITAANANSPFGHGWINPHTGNAWTVEALYDSSTTLRFQVSNTANYYNATVPLTGASGDTLNFRAMVPINEWAGAGTVNVVQNDVAYSSNNGTWDADDSTSFVAGPSGSLGGTAALSATNHYKQVRFQTPIQTTDQLVLEVSNDQKIWSPVPGNMQGPLVEGLRFDGTNYIGAGIFIPTGIANTDARVTFGKYSAGTSTAWTGTWYWRVKKFSGGQAVGFGLVQPGTSAGLVSASGLAGNTTGNAIATGYVGEKLSTTVTSIFNANGGSPALGTFYDVTSMSLTLTPGVWLLHAVGTAQATWSSGASSEATYAAAIRSGSSTMVAMQTVGLVGDPAGASGVAKDAMGSYNIATVVAIATNTTYKVSLNVVANSGSPVIGNLYERADLNTNGDTLFAIRIA